MSKLYVRGRRLDRDGDGELELEHCSLRGNSYGANGYLVQEEGGSVPERFRCKVSGKAIFDAAADMVRDTTYNAREHSSIGCLPGDQACIIRALKVLAKGYSASTQTHDVRSLNGYQTKTHSG